LFRESRCASTTGGWLVNGADTLRPFLPFLPRDYFFFANSFSLSDYSALHRRSRWLFIASYFWLLLAPDPQYLSSALPAIFKRVVRISFKIFSRRISSLMEISMLRTQYIPYVWTSLAGKIKDTQTYSLQVYARVVVTTRLLRIFVAIISRIDRLDRNV